MQQDIIVNELIEKINKEGFISLYINFDTGKATTSRTPSLNWIRWWRR